MSMAIRKTIHFYATTQYKWQISIPFHVRITRAQNRHAKNISMCIIKIIITIIVKIAKRLYYTMWNELFHKLICLFLTLPFSQSCSVALFFLHSHASIWIQWCCEIHSNCQAIYRAFANMNGILDTSVHISQSILIHFTHLTGSDAIAQLWARKLVVVFFSRAYFSLVIRCDTLL